jgi:hypothetical protein
MKTMAAAVLLGLCLSTIPASAADAPPPAQPYPVDLKVGEVYRVCNSGEVLCPAQVALCDDPKVADIVDTPDGAGFRAVGRGTTLCSAGGASGPRRVFRVTVR